jgi:4-hydroxy-4-methyl-2-oxoglutarate aldolase
MSGYLDPDDEMVQAFSKLGTTPVSDALDRLGLGGQVFGVKPVDREFTLCGRAFTVRNEPMTAGHKGESVGDYIDEVPVGGVVVIDNAARLDATVWGDILTIMADRNKLGGTVINGVCRDSQRALALNYPIFSRGTYMRTGKDRVRADAYNEPVSLGEVRVLPGDLVLGDGDGIVVIAKEHEDAVLKAAQEIDLAEERIREEIAKGGRLDSAREKFKYHLLQSRQ